MAQQPSIITYTDELLADRSVRRSYSDGRFEWRQRLPDRRVQWRDNQGNSGVDELLGAGILKRTFDSGQISYGREQGYGRTAWGTQDNLVVTVNQSSFGGRVGTILTGIGAGVLLGSIVAPPQMLSAEEEQALRERAQESSGDSGSSGGDDHDSGSRSDYDSEDDDDRYSWDDERYGDGGGGGGGDGDGDWGGDGDGGYGGDGGDGGDGDFG